MSNWILMLLLAVINCSMAAEVVEPLSPVALPEARRFAVLSLIGDSLEIVSYVGQTGTRLPTRIQAVPLSDIALDKAALLAVNDALKKAASKAPIALLTGSANLYSKQASLLEGARFVMPADLEAPLKEQKASHLVLITKYRGNAHLKLRGSSTGSGSLEGLGFYLDYTLRTERSDTGERGVGFLAPYAYFKISLIDLGTSLVVKEQVVATSYALSAARTKSGKDPWDALTSKQKVEILVAMVRQEVLSAITTLL